MSSSIEVASTPKWMMWTGRVMSTLPALMLVMSGVMKVLQPAAVLKEFERLGYPPSVALPIGIVELVSVLLYVIPRTSVLGAIVLTGYLGGAIATHVRKEESFIPVVIFSLLIWGGLYLRDSRLRALIPLKR